MSEVPLQGTGIRLMSDEISGKKMFQLRATLNCYRTTKKDISGKPSALAGRGGARNRWCTHQPSNWQQIAFLKTADTHQEFETRFFPTVGLWGEEVRGVRSDLTECVCQEVLESQLPRKTVNLTF